MDGLLRQSLFGGLRWDAPGLISSGMALRLRSVEPPEIIWWILAVSTTCAVLPRYLGEAAAPYSFLLAIGGAAPCGWAWLLSRTLFRASDPIRRWNLVVVGAIIVIEAAWHLTAKGASAGEARRLAGNAASLVCAGALLLVLIEPLASYDKRARVAERRMRQTFVGVFAAIVALTVVWAANAGEASIASRWSDSVVAACVLTVILGSRMAVSYRKRHPLAAATDLTSVKPPSAAAQDERLAARIIRAVEDNQRFATPDLKIADLAAALGEPEYKVSQCITGVLGYRNFNQLINSRRIDHAKVALGDPDNGGRPILLIAFDCGFNSIGPFNRAFKEQVGMTPREFRAHAATNR